MKHLTQANKVLAEVKATSSLGIYFKSGVFSFEENLLVSMHDASWPNEEADKVDLRVVILRNHHFVVHLDLRRPEKQNKIKMRVGTLQHRYFLCQMALTCSPEAACSRC